MSVLKESDTPSVHYSEAYLASKDSVCADAHKVYEVIDAAYDLATTITRAQEGSDRWLVKLTPKEKEITFKARAMRGLPYPVFAETVEPSVGRFLRTFEVDYSELVSIYPQFDEVLRAPRAADDTFDAFLAEVLKGYFFFGSCPWLVDFTAYDPQEAKAVTDSAGGTWVSLSTKKELALRPYIRLLDPRCINEVTVGDTDTGNMYPPLRRLKLCRTYNTYYDPDTRELGESVLTVTEVIIYTDTVNSVWQKVTGRKQGASPGKSPDFTLVKSVPAFAGCNKVGVYAGSFCTESFDPLGMVGRPPFWELALIQIGLLNAEATNGYYVDISQVPLLFGSGISDVESQKDVVVDGPGIPLITTSIPGAELHFVELSGTAAQIGAEYIARLMRAAEGIAGQTFAGRSGGAAAAATATSQVLTNADTTYYNVALAPFLERALNHMVRFIAPLLGVTDSSNSIPPIRVVPKGEDATGDSGGKESDTGSGGNNASLPSGVAEGVKAFSKKVMSGAGTPDTVGGNDGG